MAIKIQGTTIINDVTAYIDLAGPTAVKVPVGTTAERPTGVTGQLRFNSTEDTFEGYDGAAWGPLNGANQDLNTSSNVRFASLGINTNASGTAGEIRATDNITAFFSDDRLKTRIGPIEDAIKKVNTLDTFYYIPNKTALDLGYKEERHVGVSAQQVQKIMPEVVKPAPIDNKYLTVQYEKLIPLIIESIKELNAKLEKINNSE